MPEPEQNDQPDLVPVELDPKPELPPMPDAPPTQEVLAIEEGRQEEEEEVSYEQMDNVGVDRKLIDDGYLYIGTSKEDCIEYEKIVAYLGKLKADMYWYCQDKLNFMNLVVLIKNQMLILLVIVLGLLVVKCIGRGRR